MPLLGNAVEQLVAEQLQVFLEDTSALDPFQSGVQTGHGTERVLVFLTDNLCRQLDWGRFALLLLDFSAAFNMVDHDPLTHCLATIGICRIVLQWLCKLLQGQGEKVALGRSLS